MTACSKAPAPACVEAGDVCQVSVFMHVFVPNRGVLGDMHEHGYDCRSNAMLRCF